MTEANQGLVKLTWLGQAGFLIEWPESRILIDPYLSDSLYEKYKDKKFPHRRMQPAPFSPDSIGRIDMVLCTHGHSDHMDPGTLPVIAADNPECRFICPASERDKALERGVPERNFIGLADGGSFDDSIGSGISVYALASAHEKRTFDAEGRDLFLGYVMEINGCRFYHSGDCVPYAGLSEKLENYNIDVALLPVNGRDELRRSNGIPGNFTLEETVQLCVEAGIGSIIPHHFGMFDFNTEDPDRIKQVLSNSGLKYTIPVTGNVMEPGCL